MCRGLTSLPPVDFKKQDSETRDSETQDEEEFFSPRCAARRVSSKGFRYTETWLETLAASYSVPDQELAAALALSEELGAKQPDGLLYADPKALVRSRFLRCAAKALSAERTGKWTAGLLSGPKWCQRSRGPAWTEPKPEPPPEPERPESADRPTPEPRPESAGQPKPEPQALPPAAPRGTPERVQHLAVRLRAAGVAVPPLGAVRKMNEAHFLLRCGDARVTVLDRTDSGGGLLVRCGGGFSTLEDFWRQGGCAELSNAPPGETVRVWQNGKLTLRRSKSSTTLPPLRPR